MQRGQNAAHQNQRPDGWRSVEGEKEEERGRRLFVQQGSQAPLPTACTSSDCSVVRSASSDGLRYVSSQLFDLPLQLVITQLLPKLPWPGLMTLSCDNIAYDIQALQYQGRRELCYVHITARCVIRKVATAVTSFLSAAQNPKFRHMSVAITAAEAFDAVVVLRKICSSATVEAFEQFGLLHILPSRDLGKA